MCGNNDQMKTTNQPLGSKLLKAAAGSYGKFPRKFSLKDTTRLCKKKGGKKKMGEKMGAQKPPIFKKWANPKKNGRLMGANKKI